LAWRTILPARPDDADQALRCPRKRGHSTSIGGEWIGQLHAQRLYITITAPDPATVIQAARSLQPISR